MNRAILYVEVPCFYAMVELANDPELADRPVIVGGDPRKKGLVQAASPEALEAGVETEMPMVEALQLCPHARARRTDMALYREASRRLFACLRRGFERLEPFGLGAAYFELSGAREAPEAIAARLLAQVADELGLPLRAGIASGKFVARLAAEESGPAAVRRIVAGGEAAFLGPLPVARLEGVGRKTAATLATLGTHTIGDAVALGRERLEEAFGSHGLRIYALANAADDAPVRAARHAQSLSREVTVRGEALDHEVLVEHLQDLARHLAAELQQQGLCTARIALKVRYVDQGSHTPSQALSAPATAAAELQEAALRLLERTQAGSRPLRVLGIQLSKLAPAAETHRQLDLFSPPR
jgi:DNA polymerase-4